jgi:hypothetical protein
MALLLWPVTASPKCARQVFQMPRQNPKPLRAMKRGVRWLGKTLQPFKRGKGVAALRGVKGGGFGDILCKLYADFLRIA